MSRDVVAALKAFDADDNVGAIVIAGSPRAFAAGADIEEMADKTFAELQQRDIFAAWQELLAIGKPIIAAVSGYALGGGCELAMMCDFIIAADDAHFGQPEIKLGILPGIGGSQRLTRSVGKALAMDLVLTGRSITAAEAKAAGSGGAHRAGGRVAADDAGGRTHHRRLQRTGGAYGQGSGEPGAGSQPGGRHPA